MSSEIKQDGRKAWFICLGSFVINFNLPISTVCSGIIMSALMDYYQVNRAEAGRILVWPDGETSETQLAVLNTK